MFRKFLLGLGAVTLAFNAQAEDPQWLKDARAKEGAKISLHEIRSTDGWFKARVPAKAVGAIELAEGSYSLQLDVGAPSPLSCEVYPEGLDMADGLRSNFENIIREPGEGNTVEMHVLESVDAGNWDDVPWLQAHWLFRIFNGKDKLLGGARQYAFDKDGVGVYCGFSDFGYSKTTAEVVKTFATSLTFNKPAAPAYYREILVWTLRGMNIGVTNTRYVRDADGDTKSSVEMALLFPVNGKASSFDAVRHEWVQPGGELINAVAVVGENGSMASNLQLAFQDGKWIITGKRLGKEVANPVPADTTPGSAIGLSLALRELAAREKPVGAEHRMWIWDGGDLLRLNQSRAKITGVTADGFVADYTLGKDNSKVTLDRKGAVLGMQMPMGPMTLEMRRAYTSGSF